MKTNKTLLALALGAAFAPAAFGQVDLYLTGSSAFSANVRYLATNVLCVPGTWSVTTVARTGANGSAINDGTSCMTIRGTLATNSYVDASIRGQQITIYDAYAGSSEGVRDVKNSYTVEYATAGGTTVFSHSGGDAFFSDVQLEAANPPAKGTDFETGTRTNIAVITFTYVKNLGPLMSGVNNVTRDQAIALYSQSGIMNPLSLGGGDNAFDPAQAIYLAGRYPQSGTRISFEKNTGFTGSEILYDFTIPGGPDHWGDNASFAGYTSGGKMRDTLAASSNAVYNIVGYLGTSDMINTFVNTENYTCKAGLTNIAYNGVMWSSNNVVMGKYPLWSKEMAAARKGISSSPSVFKAWQAVVNALCDPVYQKANFTGRVLPFSVMQCDRSGDGTVIVTYY